MASRRQAEILMRQGRVEVDGEVVKEMGRRVDPDSSVIHVDGSRVVTDTETVHLALNKPEGMLSTMWDEHGRRCVGDVVLEKASSTKGLFHVGRLDAATEGLLLLTNDGELANRLMHPSYEVPKTYLAEIRTPIAKDLGRQLRAGVELDDGPAAVDSFRVIDRSGSRVMVEVVLHEGRNRIVRRIFEAVDKPVERLVRTAVGDVHLGDQRPAPCASSGVTRSARCTRPWPSGWRLSRPTHNGHSLHRRDNGFRTGTSDVLGGATWTAGDACCGVSSRSTDPPAPASRPPRAGSRCAWAPATSTPARCTARRRSR